MDKDTQSSCRKAVNLLNHTPTTKTHKASLLALVLVSALSGCGGVSGVSSGGGGNNKSQPLNVDFQIDYVATIPVLSGSPTSSFFYVHNDGDTVLTGISYSLAGASAASSNGASSSTPHSSNSSSGLVQSSHKLYAQAKLLSSGDVIDSNGFILKGGSLANCSTIAAHSYCAIEFTTPNLSIANQNNSLLKVSVVDGNGFKHSYDQVINYSYYDATLRSGVNFVSSADVVANLTNKKYMQAYLVGGGSSGSYSNVNLQISDSGSLALSQGFVAGQGVAAGQLIPIEFSVNINSEQPYPIDVTPQYLVGSSVQLQQASLSSASSKPLHNSLSSLLTAGQFGAGQSLFVNATSKTDSSLALKLGSVSILVAPSSEANAATIYVSSFGAVSGLTIEPDSSNVQVYANNCGSTIESNASCSFKLGVSATSSGSSTIIFKVKGTPIYSLVAFYAPSTPVDGEANLINEATVGVIGLLANQSSSIINLVFSNLGLNDLTDLIFTPRNSSNGSSKLEIVSNSCDPLIAPQTQCLIQVRLVGGTQSEQGCVYLDIAGKAGSKPFTAQSNTIDYYINTSSSLIIASPIGSRATLSVIGNGKESQTAVFTLQNTSTEAVTINSAALTGTDLSADLRISDNQCSSSLAAGQSCNVTVKYGPMLIESAQSGIANLNINYGASDASNNLTGIINYSAVGLDSALVLTNVTTTGFSGAGTQPNPYAANGCDNTTQTITLTYKNISTSFVAQNMALDIIDGHLTPYMLVDAATSTCGYGSIPKDLGVGQSCNLVLTPNKVAMDDSSSYNLDVVYPSASWNTTQGFVTQSNFMYNGSNTAYAGYTQPTLVSSISPASGNSLNRTLTQTLVNADSCPSLNTKISSLSSFGVTAAPTTATAGCTVNNDGSVNCINSVAAASNAINYTLNNNIPRPADLFFQFTLENSGLQVWYSPSVLLFNFSY